MAIRASDVEYQEVSVLPPLVKQIRPKHVFSKVSGPLVYVARVGEQVWVTHGSCVQPFSEGLCRVTVPGGLIEVKQLWCGARGNTLCIFSLEDSVIYGKENSVL